MIGPAEDPRPVRVVERGVVYYQKCYAEDRGNWVLFQFRDRLARLDSYIHRGYWPAKHSLYRPMLDRHRSRPLE